MGALRKKSAHSLFTDCSDSGCFCSADSDCSDCSAGSAGSAGYSGCSADSYSDCS